jgi:hypothetical protein
VRPTETPCQLDPAGTLSVPRSPYEASNTRDQLRGAHDLALVHDDPVGDDDASTRPQPPLVSCIALFGGAPRASRAGDAMRRRCRPDGKANLVPTRLAERCPQACWA